jgi:hypothetical protein
MCALLKKIDLTVVATCLSVVAAFLLFFATLGLYRATRDLVTDARIASQNQLRAYVLLTTAAVSDNNVDIVVTNTGQTPAYNVTTSCVSEYRTPGPVHAPDFHFTETGPGPQIWVVQAASGKFLTVALLKTKSGRLEFCTHGA